MKKFLLGLAALTMSASAFGAIMSPKPIPDSGNSTTTVALPIRLEANVVDGSKRLFIEGTSGNNYGDALVLDFGDVARGHKAETSGKVRVFRGMTDGATPTELGGKLGFKFIIDEATNAPGEVGKRYEIPMKKYTVPTPGTPGTEVTPTKFNAIIGLSGINVLPDDMPKATEVIATVVAETGNTDKNTDEGKYQGRAALEATLTITGA